MQTISYILSIVATCSILLTFILKGKNMRLILGLVFAANVLIATSYLMGDEGLSGAVSCFLGAAIAVINYLFESKNKDIPKVLLTVYGVLFAALNLAVSGFELATFVVIAATTGFVLSCAQKNGKNYRFFMIFNVTFWCLYDILTKSYPGLLSHGIQIVILIMGIIINDRKPKD